MFGCLVYLLVVIGRAAATEPYVDEGWYTMSAWNLALNGSFGTPVLEPSASPNPDLNISLRGIRKHTYIYMVLPIIAQAGWFKIFGFSLLTTRLFSTMWAAVVLIVWFLLMRRLSGSVSTAVLAIILIGTDHVFVWRAGFGRPEMMSAALGFSGILAYLILRERSLGWAMVVANAFVAASGLTHPNGGIVIGAGLLALVLWLDRSRIGWRLAALAILPYAASAALMTVYVLQAPDDFAAQFLSNSRGRLTGILSPATLLPREIMRYLDAYGFNTGRLVSRLKTFVLAVYLIGAIIVCMNARIRKQYHVLLLLSVVCVGALAVFENYKVQWYVVYIAPMLAALTAAGFEAIRPQRRWIAGALLVSVVLLNLGISARAMLRNTYRNEYLPMTEFLEAHASDSSLVMGSSEIGFQYGFNRNLLDDIRLGYHSGKRPDFVVIDDRYRTCFRAFEKSEPDVYRHVMKYLETECRPVFTVGQYSIYGCQIAAGR